MLAVGDAEFQKKAIGKMKDVSQGQGRTVLFVSHNMASIRNLCKTGVVLKNGMMDFMGTADEAVDFYIGNNTTELCNYAEITDAHRNFEFLSRELELLSVRLYGDTEAMASNQALVFDIKMQKNANVSKATMEIMFNNQSDMRLGSYISDYFDVSSLKIGDEFTLRVNIPHHNFAKGTYRVCFNVGQKDVAVGAQDYDIVHNVLSFEIQFADEKTRKPFAYWPSYNGNGYYEGNCQIM